MTLDREYFEGDNQNIGYRAEGFRDFPVHFGAVGRIRSLNPTSVLELGGARGYVAKKLIACGIPTTVLEISEHCYHTRVIDSFVAHDIEKTPYPFADKQFDLVFSDSVMEHLHYEKIDEVIKEITRVSKRSLHGVPITESGQTREQFMGDNTHVIYESRSWWKEKYLNADPTHTVEISGDIMGDLGRKLIMGVDVPSVSFNGNDLVKLNVGSFINMFYYGWTNTDILDLSKFVHRDGYIFNQHDSKKPFPVKDGYVNLIFTSHMLEHLSFADSKSFLKECYRMLCEGGHIRIAVPSAGLLAQQYIDHNLDYLKHISPAAEKSKCDIDKFHEVALSNHAQLFDACSLRLLIESAGFRDVQLSDPFHSRSEIMEKETIVSHPTISLVMEATK
jgi:predicted SAM-dependent methyltransferase